MNTKARHLGRLVILALALCLTMACSEKSDDAPVKPDTPTTPSTPTGNKFTIAPTGGTVETGDIVIQIPSGTFEGETAIYVDKVSEGSVRGEDELSPFYKVTMPVSTGKPIKVSIKCSDTDDDIIFIARTKAVSLYGDISTDADMPLDFTYYNGKYTAEIPCFNNDQVAGTLGDITFGLARSASAKTESLEAENESTRAEGGKIKFKFDWGSYAFALENTKLQELMESYLTEALGKIQKLGCKVDGDRTIPIIITPASKLGLDEYGRFEMGFWSKKWSYILINDGFIGWQQNCTKENLRSTMIHELFHYFQADYDPRFAWFKGGVVDTSGEYLMLYESGGVWAEKFMNGNDFSYIFVSDEKRAFSVMRGLTTVVNNDYQNHGYGLSVFLEYMTKQKGDSAMLNLLEVWHKDNSYDALTVLKDWAKAIKVDVFSNDGFLKYLTDVSTQVIIPRFGFPTIVPAVGNTHIEDKKKVSADGTSYYEGKVNPYGARFSSYQINDYPLPIEKKRLTFTEEKDGVTTYVYERIAGKYQSLGAFSKKSALVIEDEEILKSLLSKTSSVNVFIYMLTVSDDVSKNGESKVTVVLEDKIPTLKLDTHELIFEGNGGEQTVGVTTNQETVSVSTTASWLDARYDAGNKRIVVKAEKNPSEQEEREAYVIARVQNSSGSEEQTVHVTQEKQEKQYIRQYAGAIVRLTLSSTEELYIPSLGGRAAAGTTDIRADGTFDFHSVGTDSTSPTYLEISGMGWICTFITTSSWDISINGRKTAKGIELSGTVSQHFESQTIVNNKETGAHVKTQAATSDISFSFSNLVDPTLLVTGNTQSCPYGFSYSAWRAKGATLNEFGTYVHDFKWTDIDVYGNQKEITLSTYGGRNLAIVVGLWEDDNRNIPAGRN